jgi:hypothetical protein
VSGSDACWWRKGETKSKPRTITTWMPQCSQMLRHMDGAWEIREGKRVLGIMIVEGSAETGTLEPDNYWRKQAHEQIKEECLTRVFRTGRR